MDTQKAELQATHMQRPDLITPRIMDDAPLCESSDVGVEVAGQPASIIPERKYLDIDMAGLYLRCSKRTIYKLCALRKLAYHEAAGVRWFLKEDLDEYIASGRVGVYGGRRRSRKTA